MGTYKNIIPYITNKNAIYQHPLVERIVFGREEMLKKLFMYHKV